MMKLFAAAIFIASLAWTASGQTCVEKAHEVKPAMTTEATLGHQKRLSEAKAAYDGSPTADNLIWLGRRTAYLGDYKTAIRIFSDGISKYPRDARFYRHRGHRLITLRCFDDAIADLEKASVIAGGTKDEVEPDGMPNSRNIPTSTLQTNIYYHLGIAYYMKGDWSRAAGSFMNSFLRSTNSDMKVASALWAYASAARHGKKESTAAGKLLATQIGDDLDIIENHDYYKLIKLNKGKLKPEELLAEVGGEARTLSSASLGYGLGNYFLYNGDNAKARSIFQKIVAGDQWASFGYIAAEAELRRGAE